MSRIESSNQVSVKASTLVEEETTEESSGSLFLMELTLEKIKEKEVSDVGALRGWSVGEERGV